MKLQITFFQQDTDYTCGPTALQMAFNYFGLIKSEDDLAHILKTSSNHGTFHKKMIDTARQNGFYCYVNNNSTIHEINHYLKLGLPVIVHFTETSENDTHYSIVYGVTTNSVLLNDPWNGKIHLSRKNFMNRWHGCVKNVCNEGWMMVISKDNFNLGRQYLPY